ncbi:16S rRNA (cytosine(1402)-N(4))-methyltransferase RsmH [Aliidiomarina sanyensis]|uniref:Ribosomal RNA small subunit methyltransferase H n=1 Tax=Aliidiomarina sanyensis TaxID=1249555 RepID=A0A432WI84_9GAMM|nr:16S rRNA (cytosine(1402)-N(4))-methyltransferase RsmH [Aliidiomarina sanyensis]RUO33478.1 16S rRNA (cytosine(1402)-N(4))-methyltransferase [Aliidiomarina sanyensis]
MAQTPQHVPVLLAESIEALAIQPDQIYIDATFGRGGHSRAVLAELGPEGRLIAFDRDPTAAQAAQALTNDPRFHFFHTPFSALADIIEQEGLHGRVAGILFDLGVSSPQLDDAERGFSFMRDGPLDMRMNPEQDESAADWLARADMDEMAHVFRTYGEERFAGRIARAIIEHRQEHTLTRTHELADLISKVSPTREKHKHPATRVFQAIRIHINRELEEVEVALKAAVDALKPGGRLAVISFHSLEDRIAKQFIRAQSRRAQLPAGLPLREDQIEDTRTLNPIGKAIKPSAQELKANPRARSSVLRIAERLP